MGQAELSTINEPEFVNFLGPQASILCEEIEDFRIVVICCVWGKDTPVGQHISNMQYLVLTNSRNRFSHNPSKNTGFVLYLDIWDLEYYSMYS